MRRSTEIGPNLITLLDSMPRLEGYLARRHLCHTYSYEAHQPNTRVDSLDEDKSASGHGADEGLRKMIGGWVRTIWVDKTHRWGFGVVGTSHINGLDDCAVDGAMPAVVAQNAEEGLIHGPADKLGCVGIVVEHMVERI